MSFTKTFLRVVNNKNERICTPYNDEIENVIYFWFHCCKLEPKRKLYSNNNYFDKDRQNENSRFALLCTENYVLRTRKFIRHLYDEGKHILHKD